MLNSFSGFGVFPFVVFYAILSFAVCMIFLFVLFLFMYVVSIFNIVRSPLSCIVSSLFCCVTASCAESSPYSSLDLMIEFNTVSLNAVVQSL